MTQIQEVTTPPMEYFVSLSKAQVIDKSNQIVNDICENGGDSLALLSLACKLELFAKEIKSNLSKRAISEVEKYDNNVVSKNGVTLSLSSTTQYEYDNSEAWVYQNAIVEDAKKVLKEIETIAKATKTQTIWTSEDGVMLNVLPAIKKSQETIKATIK